MEEIRISVRDLVEFILRSGDIDNRYHGSSENAMQEGSRIHRMIQKKMGSDYQSEVTLRYCYVTDKYTLVIEGRADGVIDTATEKMIDEIKSTYRDLARMKEPVPVHLAQAKCYAYIYASQKGLEQIRVRMTYCHVETEEIRYFNRDYTMEELSAWFDQIREEYLKWADYQFEWKRTRDESIRQLEFPYEYRKGQKELVTYVYQTIYHKRKLFIEAPTGVGKTISTVFPSIKAMERGMGERIFYLTAKTITGTVAQQAFGLLREKGLHFKSLSITAKEKACFLSQMDCNPEKCPYAKGHFDRINAAVYDFITSEEDFTREKLEAYALKHQVCPYEFSLDVSLFADGIIGDYNYLFDPHVHLKRFFAEGSSGNYIFLIDEAHNLLERGREMYSAELIKEEVLQLKNGLQNAAEEGKNTVLFGQKFAYSLIKHLEKCNKELLEIKRECEAYCIVESVDKLVQTLLRIQTVVESYLEETEETEVPVREQLLDFYFKVCHFLDIYERMDEKYVKYAQLRADGSFLVKLFCVDPSGNLKECMQKGRSSVLFSATFLPIRYYKSLLGGEEQDYEVYANSVFDRKKRLLVIGKDVTSKYTRRSEQEFYNIAKYIKEIVKKKRGNYMVFCPSHQFLQEVYTMYREWFEDEETECIIQSVSMNEAQREQFLQHFEGNRSVDVEQAIQMQIEYEEDKFLIGFCVLGGIFGEGIDLKKDSLIGVIIVGTGLPQVCYEREILKQYFDDNGGDGFDYAYRYPGMNKVLQAAGRVIRTVDDVGVVAILDERFLQSSYIRIFPREWDGFLPVNLSTVGACVEDFWHANQ